MECERASAHGYPRQGDILAAHPGSTNWSDRWRRFYVVLSADCDLAQNKTGPNMVCAPIVDLPTYLTHVWLPAQASRVKVDGEGMLRKVLNEVSIGEITAKHLDSWTTEQLEALLAARPVEEREKLIARANGLRASLSELSNIVSGPAPATLTDCVTLLQRYFTCAAGLGKGTLAQAEHQRKAIQAALSALVDRIDTWLLCDIPGCDPDMRESDVWGFVIDLRRFVPISVSSVHVDKGHWLASKEAYFRVCRLRGLYKTDLLQRFATLFVRVGLEDSRDQEHARIFERTASRLVAGQS